MIHCNILCSRQLCCRAFIWNCSWKLGRIYTICLRLTVTTHTLSSRNAAIPLPTSLRRRWVQRNLNVRDFDLSWSPILIQFFSSFHGWRFSRPRPLQPTVLLLRWWLSAESGHDMLYVMLVAYLLNGKGIILIYLMYFMVWNIVCVLWKVDLKAFFFCEWRIIMFFYYFISLVLGTGSMFIVQVGSRLVQKFMQLSGSGGLVVSMLASDTRVHGFEPGRSRWIFRVSE